MSMAIRLGVGCVAAAVALVFVVLLLNTPPDPNGPDLSGDLPDCVHQPRPTDC